MFGLACVQHFDHKTGETQTLYLKGRMLVTRSPVIHPGDAQVLHAIGVPPADSPFAGEGNQLFNCVVFSSRGDRPVPNMLGGGDLGELYAIGRTALLADNERLDGVGAISLDLDTNLLIISSDRTYTILFQCKILFRRTRTLRRSIPLPT